MKTSDILREYAKDFGACGPQYTVIASNLNAAADELDEVKRYWFTDAAPWETEFVSEYSEWCSQ